MESRKFRVYNQTRKSFLGVEVILADPSEVHLDTLIGNLALQAGEGLWLKPFREIPKDHALPLFGLIYLNRESSVIEVVELYPGLGPEPLAAQATSALVLSVGAILASRTQPGDQLVIDARERIESMPAAPPIQAAPDAEEQKAEPPPEQAADKLPRAVGRDFSPGISPAVSTWALAPEVWFSGIQLENEPFSAASEGPKPEEIPTLAFPEVQEAEPPPDGPQPEEIPTLAFPEVQETKPPLEEPRVQEVSAPPPPDERTLQLQRAIQQLNESEAVAEAPKKESLKIRFMRWLDADRKPHQLLDRRQARRTPLPGLVAFYWTGGNPHPYRIADISESGLFLITGDRSTLGTIFMLTLQRTDSDGEHLGDAISVYGEVVRWGADGVAFEFIPSKPARHARGYTLPGNPADQGTLSDFVQRLNQETHEPR